MREHKPWPVAAVLAVECLTIAALLTVALDQYAHKRVEQLGGVNSWGYRGTIMRNRQPREFRIGIVGGNHAFGWGVAPRETIAGYLRTFVQDEMKSAGLSRQVTAFNLGALGLPARDYAGRLAQFSYLAPDVICLYLDLQDTHAGSVMPPFDSAVTALTGGYVPMLPLVLEERGLPLLASTGRTLRRLDRWLYGVTVGSRDASDQPRLDSVSRAIDVALAMAPVVVVVPMPMTPLQQGAEGQLVQLVQARAEVTPRLRLVDLAREPRLSDPALFVDGVNYGAGGHSIAADEIGPALMALALPAVEHR